MKAQEVYEKVRQHAQTMKQFAAVVSLDGNLCNCKYTPEGDRPPCLIGILLTDEQRRQGDLEVAASHDDVFAMAASKLVELGNIKVADMDSSTLGSMLDEFQYSHDWVAEDWLSTGGKLTLLTNERRDMMVRMLDRAATRHGLKVVV